MCATDASRTSKRWLIAILYGMINVAASNASKNFRENGIEHIKRTKFIVNLGIDLSCEHLGLQKQQKNMPVYNRVYS